MRPLKLLPPLALALFVASNLSAQQASDFKITKITPSFVESPTYSGPQYQKRSGGGKAGAWLEVEVAFDWQPRQKEPKYTDELTINYYILLGNKSQLYPQGTLLTGSVTHVNIPQGRDLHSAVYVSPRTLERFFDGKTIPAVGQAVEAVGVTISKQGQLVAEDAGKFQPQWWTKWQQTPGYVLNKNETPFAPLAWDYFEAIKSKAPGQ